MDMIKYMKRVYVVYATRITEDEVEFYIYYISKDGDTKFWTWIDSEDCIAYRR